ncbi:ECF transporter S component [Alkaliphilus transvaalensis]|uniref:ECF transporter S component n=1 Tax=Alkaliphilus transvaalensis TaxID=114628 RepID=UPI0006855D33|nr:ECF transporter S component [Alkaliphilus transvaalensis]
MLQQSSYKKKPITIEILVKLSLLIALSGVGAYIKIQGSIALDSLPAFFAALYMGPVFGGVVGLIGHLVSSMTAGFPLTLPMHLVIALQMWCIVYAFGIIWRRINPLGATIIAILLNGPLAALVAAPVSSLLGLPLKGWTLFLVMWLPLTAVSIVNVSLAAILFKRLRRN